MDHWVLIFRARIEGFCKLRGTYQEMQVPVLKLSAAEKKMYDPQKNLKLFHQFFSFLTHLWRGTFVKPRIYLSAEIFYYWRGNRIISVFFLFDDWFGGFEDSHRKNCKDLKVWHRFPSSVGSWNMSGKCLSREHCSGRREKKEQNYTYESNVLMGTWQNQNI